MTSNNFNHILLIQPRSKKYYARSFDTGGINSHPAISMLALASVLKCHGYEVRLLDRLVQKFTQTQFSQLLSEFEPGVIGLSVLTETFPMAEKIAGEVKRQLKNCRVVFGGAFPSFEYQTVLQSRDVDFVIRFEGEDPLLELLMHLQQPDLLPLSQIPGLVYRQGDKICVNAARSRTKGLDALPLMDRDLLPPSLYTHGGTISSGRGCGYHCIFCSSAAMFGAAPRMRSAENVFAEIYYLNQHYGITQFHFVDQAFTASQQRTETLCRYVIESELDIQWRCMSRIDAVSRDLLKSMQAAGCTEIEYGVESGDPDVLKEIGKGITLEKILETIHFSRDLGLNVVCFFMIGHYADTRNTIENTIAFCQELKNRHGVDIIARMNTPFPGTYQYEHATDLGLQIHAESWEDYSYAEAIVSNAHFDKEQLRNYYYDLIKGMNWC